MSATTAAGPVWTIVVAAGGGRRFGGPKQFVDLAGRSVLEWAVSAAASVSDGVVAVVPAGDVARSNGVVGPGCVSVPGGTTRSESVRCGLDAVPADASVILVHDAARPAASPELFARVVEQVRAGAAAVVPAVDVVDSLRRRDGSAVDRRDFVAIQTPQGFAAGVLRAAHDRGGNASDDATMVEASGGTIVVVPGETANVKLTNPDDLAGLATTLAERVR